MMLWILFNLDISKPDKSIPKTPLAYYQTYDQCMKGKDSLQYPWAYQTQGVCSYEEKKINVIINSEVK